MLPSTRARVGASVGVRWGNMRRTVKHDLPTAGKGMRTKRREERGRKDAPPPPKTVSLYSRGACNTPRQTRRREGREWVDSERQGCNDGVEDGVDGGWMVRTFDILCGRW